MTLCDKAYENLELDEIAYLTCCKTEIGQHMRFWYLSHVHKNL